MSHELGLLFVANFIFIFLKAFQQSNVAHYSWKWVVPTSFLMATAEVYLIVKIAAGGFIPEAVLVLGIAGGSGSLAAMYLHKKHIRRM